MTKQELIEKYRQKLKTYEAGIREYDPKTFDMDNPPDDQEPTEGYYVSNLLTVTIQEFINDLENL